MLNSKSIGNKIADARKKINLSQAELAKQVSISPQAVGKWERGESMPDIMTLNRLAEIFLVDLNYFSESFHLEETLTEPNCQVKEDSKTVTRKTFDWNWDMSKGNWVDADFSGLKNLKEKFSSSNLKNCKFINSELIGIVFEKNNIELCDFSSSDIRDGKIKYSNLLNSQFSNCSFIDSELVKNNIGKCDFSGANFSGSEFSDGYFEKNNVANAVWEFTSFKNTGISEITFEGIMEDCHFENCTFQNVTFENATILNTFFKYNQKFKKVQFINCSVDKITYAFLKSNEANMTGIAILE